MRVERSTAPGLSVNRAGLRAHDSQALNHTKPSDHGACRGAEEKRAATRCPATDMSLCLQPPTGRYRPPSNQSIASLHLPFLACSSLPGLPACPASLAAASFDDLIPAPKLVTGILQRPWRGTALSSRAPAKAGCLPAPDPHPVGCISSHRRRAPQPQRRSQPNAKMVWPSAEAAHIK